MVLGLALRPVLTGARTSCGPKGVRPRPALARGRPIHGSSRNAVAPTLSVSPSQSYVLVSTLSFLSYARPSTKGCSNYEYDNACVDIRSFELGKGIGQEKGRNQ